ncbi:MAG: hypothetical protein SGPRY_008555, partial [Prymnesium sp.]
MALLRPGLALLSLLNAEALLLGSRAAALPRGFSSTMVATESTSTSAPLEKRWADRKSRLGLLDGFRFFCMMRRCERDEAYNDDINYISCTVWENEGAYDAWKSGDAFKEAHGGGTIGGIASMLLATAMNTKGKPKAAMWEGILPVSIVPDAAPNAGWREVVADGESILPGECYIAMNRFSVKEGFEGTFEQRFASRESTLETFDGFKGFLLLRRDGKDPDGVTHSTFSIWKDKASFEAWRLSEKPAPKESSGPEATKSKQGKPDIFV